MSFIKGIIEQHLSSSDHLSKKHIHPRLSKLLDLGGMNVAFTRAQGSYLWDIDDTRYLDLLSGGGVHFIGRHHPEVRGAIEEVNRSDLPNLCVVNSSVLGGLLAERLLEMSGPGFTKIQYSNSGAEANEVAIRFARFCTRKRRFLHLSGSFHGRTFATISLCGFRQMNEGMDPKLPTCTMITPNDIEELRYELSKGDVAGVFYEYCQGMTLTVLEREYLHEMRRLCTEYGAMMIADEVQTGIARMGDEWFAFQKAGIRPDMVTLSKALSGGAVPVAATLISTHVYDTVFAKFKSGPIYFSTFAENNLAMAAGLATMKVLTDMDARTRATELAAKIRTGMEEIQSRYDVIESVVGEGLMIGAYFRPSESRTLLRLQQKLLSNADKGVFGAAVNVELFTKHQVIAQIPGPELNAVKILPPVNLQDEDVTQFLEAFDATMESMYKSGGPALPLGKAAVKDAFRSAKSRLLGSKNEDSEKKKQPRKEGQLFEYSDYDEDLTLHCDVLVVGSGPGGAIAAEQLARTGKKVIILEAGPKVRHGDTRRDAGHVLNRYFYYGGMRSSRGNTVMPSMQPRNLGGGSVWNSGICMRLPQYVLDRYQAEHGLAGFAEGKLDRHFEAVEEFMGVKPAEDDIMGPRNLLFAEGCSQVGFEPTRVSRNESGCKGASECFTLCPNDAKLSMDRRGIPELLAHGGSVYTSVQAHELIKEGRKVVGLRGRVVHPTNYTKSYKVEVHAKVTVLAAGCLATPEILQRSGVGNQRVGQNLRFHPGSMVMGEFEEEIEPWSGATQGYHCLDFMKEGIKLESLWATSSLMGCRFPGLGSQLQTLLKNYAKMCSWDCWVSGEDSIGHVQRRRGRRADIVYNIGQGDADRMIEAMAKLCEMFEAVGAISVMTGVHGLEAPATDIPKMIETLRSRTFKVQEVPFASNHIFGTTAMGDDSTRYAVDPSGALYDAENVYVCDTGLLPTTPSANPMLPTMAIVHMICENIAQQY